MEARRHSVWTLFAGTLREAGRIALGAIRSNKLRSFLTVLGIVIGVTVIITLVSLIEGLSNNVAEQIGSLGSNYIYIGTMPAIQMGRPDPEIWFRPELTLGDVEAIAGYCPDVEAVTPYYYTSGRVTHGGYSTDTIMITGGNEDFCRVNALNVELGRDLTLSDVRSRRRVVIVGSDIAEALFGSRDPVGREVRISRHKFTVVGLLERRGEFLGQSQDVYVVVPHTLFETIFEPTKMGRNALFIIAASTSPATVLRAADQIESLLRRRRGVGPGEENDFEISTQGGLLEVFEEMETVLYAVLVGVASMSLLVGGIGIMNIMLVAVTERTREIGVRKAIGARRRDITAQFVTEAVVLTLFGGVIGVALGWGLAAILAAALELPNAITWWSIALGLSFSVIVGLFFGTYPAVKAANLDPIEALRYE
jgi:putative ABC transport system permease protein